MANLPRVLLRYRRHPAQATQMRRDAMESVNCRIRAEALARQGFTASNEELRLHNMVRAQASITSIEDLRGIEAWLLKLRDAHADASARRVVASQWTRACVRAAPLGRTMREAYMVSPLRAMAGEGARTSLDLRVLSALRLNYRSPVFSGLRRLGLSA